MKTQVMRWQRIKENSRGPYVTLHGRKFYLDEFMRIEGQAFTGVYNLSMFASVGIELNNEGDAARLYWMQS